MDVPRRVKRGEGESGRKPVTTYVHEGKDRLNNPPVGLVTPETDPQGGAKQYSYDPHLDPQLVWAGKAERTSFEVPTVSLHVHERIDPLTILEAVRRHNGERVPEQVSLFEQPRQNPPLREAVEFYKHKHDWSNRLIAGDSLLVMNSLLEKEGMAGQVQMIYMDPPYGIRYGSNFQPFVNKRDVKEGRDEDLTHEPEMIKAFRDTWELGIHSYLSYLRDRLLLARELLADSGSVFVQIGDENLHYVRTILDEVLGRDNFVALITFAKTSGATSKLLPSVADYLVWYAKNRRLVKYRQLYLEKAPGGQGSSAYNRVELPDGTRRPMTKEERLDPSRLPEGSRIYRLDNLTSQGFQENTTVPFEFEGRVFHPGAERHWKTTVEGLRRLAAAGRLEVSGNTLSFVRYIDDFPAYPLTNHWTDTVIAGFASDKRYVVETNPKVVERCILMTTDPGDLVFDPTCGSGTTAYVAEQWGRRWITCDTSRVALTLAKQRLMTAVFDYYELARPEEGVSSGFRYRTVPHITLRSIANDEPPQEEILYDQPYVDRSKVRVTGPFTVEAVPAPAVRSIEEVMAGFEAQIEEADQSVTRTGETVRQRQWRDELLKTGIRGKGGQRIEFARVEPLAGTRYLHAEGETRGDRPELVVISFGPEHAPLEQRQVSLALEEAMSLVPRPTMVVFAAFQFDPEAAKDIDETRWPGVTLLKVQMNPDLLTEDLKRKRASNDSFWLIGQPDVDLRRVTEGEHQGLWQVEVKGFDYFDTRTGQLVSGGAHNIAMWMLDPDYDGRSLYPRQVFFPMADGTGGWARLARTLRAEIDPDLIEQYWGTTSLPFPAGPHRRAAVKIIDDRGIESLKVLALEDV